MLAGVVEVAQPRKLMTAWVVVMMMDLCGTNSQVQFEGSKVRLEHSDVARGAVLLLDELAGVHTVCVPQLKCPSGFTC